MNKTDTRTSDQKPFGYDSIKLIHNITISLEKITHKNFKLEFVKDCLVKPNHNLTISHEKNRHKSWRPESFWLRLYQTNSQYYNFT